MTHLLMFRNTSFCYILGFWLKADLLNINISKINLCIWFKVREGKR